MKKLNTLYKVVKGNSKQIGDYIPIQLIGTDLSVTVYGGECSDITQEEIILSNLSDLAPDDSPFITEGIETFVTIPQYIAIVGTGTDAGFDISNVRLTEIKSIS